MSAGIVTIKISEWEQLNHRIRELEQAVNDQGNYVVLKHVPGRHWFSFGAIVEVKSTNHIIQKLIHERDEAAAEVRRLKKRSLWQRILDS